MGGDERGQALMEGPAQSEAGLAPCVVLVEPQLGENIGMAARAMGNFGLSDLRLVGPREPWPNPKAKAAAAGADAILDGARVFETLGAALGGVNLVLATTARPRDMFKPVMDAGEAVDRAAAHVAAGGTASFLFGRERWGLTNEEVALADAMVTLPVEPDFGSLNVAHAVAVVAYEWRKAATGGALPFEGRGVEAASREELAAMVEHLEAALARTDFFTPPEKRTAMMVNLRAMFSGAGFNPLEVRMLRGVISALEKGRHRARHTGEPSRPGPRTARPRRR